MAEKVYWKPDRLLSYDRIVNMVVGGRSIGKTYGIKKQIIKEFIEKGHQFIYLRRYKGELKKVGQFFDAVSKEFPDAKFEVKGREFWINGKKAGYAIPLSAWQSEKGVDYPNVRTIFFDEFLREKDNSR
ncbi:phage DNA encapsidation protein, partial [Bacillus subtilis]